MSQQLQNARSLLNSYLLVSLACDHETDRDWLRENFAMLKEKIRQSWAYQEILQEGREQALEQARHEATQEKQRLLLDILQARFPRLVLTARALLPGLEDPESLRHLIVRVSLAQTHDEVHHALLDLANNGKDAA